MTLPAFAACTVPSTGWAGVAGLHRSLDGLGIAHLADNHQRRLAAHGVAHPDLERRKVARNLALGDNAVVALDSGEEIFHR